MNKLKIPFHFPLQFLLEPDFNMIKLLEVKRTGGVLFVHTPYRTGGQMMEAAAGTDIHHCAKCVSPSWMKFGLRSWKTNQS